MSTRLNVLIIEDVPDDEELIVMELRRGGFDLTYRCVQSEQAFLDAVDGTDWDAIISDYSVPGFGATACLRLYADRNMDIPFILVSGTVGEDVAVQAMKAGAHDYIMKDRLHRLTPAIQRELKEAAIRREHRRMADYLEFIAYHDPLTELSNQHAFEEALVAEIDGEPSPQALAVVVIEVINFDEVRNVLGVEPANLLMRDISIRLKQIFVQPMMIARLTETSFGVLIKLAAVKDAESIGRSCLAVFDHSFELQISQLHVDPNIGIAVYPDHGNNATMLLRHAFLAAKQAALKAAPFSIYVASEDRATPERLALLGNLRHAIDGHELRLHYQPVVELGRGRVRAVEALVRWQHPQRGLLAPAAFLDGAEESGLIRPLTHWVIEEAFRQARRWQQANRRIPIYVNLSARNVEELDLPEFIQATLDATQADPGLLGFEITESAMLRDYAVAIQVLQAIHQQGFKISLDDFGTGQSSLRYLQRLPIDQIKIDRSFVSHLHDGHEDQTIIRAILDIAGALGLTVVAEGVERRESAELLKDMGCPYAQGYFFSKPLAIHELEPVLDSLPWRTQAPLSAVALKQARDSEGFE